MKKITLILLVCIGFASISAIMKEDGRAGATGSPGETTCNTSQCHTGNTVNAAGGSIVISAPTLTNWEYVPGTVYPISVTVARSSVSLFGLGFEALRSTGANGGTLVITNATQTKILNAFIGGNNRSNVVHKQNGGASSGSHTFNFNWTAPVAGTGNVTFYSAGNAANGNGNAAGDFIYTTSHIVTEMTSGIKDITDESAMQVYPNPVVDKFKVRFNLKESAFVEIKMLDTQGKVVSDVLSNTLPAGEQELQHTPMINLSPGVYFLQMIIDGKQAVKRIAVM